MRSPLVPKALRRTLFALGLALVLAAGATQWLAARAEHRFPPLGRTIEVDGLRQQVLDVGEGDVLVLLHGAYGGMHDYAATVLDELATRYRCIAWDRPGHGYSERPPGDLDPGDQARWLGRVLDALEVERAVLVGFSYGGAVALAAALDDAERVAGVVLVNGPSHPWPDPLDLEYRIAGVPLLGALAAYTVTAPLGTWLGPSAVAEAFAPLPVHPDFEARSPLALALRPQSYLANTNDIRLLKEFLREQTRRYPQLHTPVLALVAEGDRVVSPTIHLPALVDEAPDCRQIRIPGAGHQLLYTHPGRVVAAIDELARVTSAP